MTTSVDPAELRSDERIIVLGLLLETASELSKVLGRELERRVDLPITWFEVLLRLACTPGQRMRMVELARQISFTDSGLSRLADRMEKAGLIGRELDRTDRRGTLAVLTDAGREVLDRAVPVHLEGLQARVFDRLSDREAATLGRLLRKLREN